jgi:hypothetical protein
MALALAPGFRTATSDAADRAGRRIIRESGPKFLIYANIL